MSASIPWLGKPLPLAGVLFMAAVGPALAGLLFGNMLVAGQAEPLQWLWPQLAAMFLVGLTAGRAVMPVVLAFCGWAGSLSAILLLCGVAGRFWPWSAMAELSVLSLLALAAGWRLARPGRWRWAGAAAVVGLVAVAAMGGEGAGAARLSSMRLDVLAGPPLLPPSPLLEDDGAARPIDAVLRQVDLRLHDQLTQQGLAGAERLLLVQPRLLNPTELVAVDQWVRGGGKAVILADPLLSWPGATDGAGRVPATSLLDPLLQHWGLALEPVAVGKDGVERRFLDGGALLALASASHFSVKGGTCQLVEAGLIALCRIGSGEVRLIADADWLHDGLWLADPQRPADRGNMSSDNVALLDRWLAQPLATQWAPDRPVNWVRDDGAIVRGVRAALMAGLGWAMLGAGCIWVLSRRNGRPPHGPAPLVLGTTGEHRRLNP